MERLREDVTCSICLDVLEDPVSIECGHNFCRGCLTTHWRGDLDQGPRCPECRRPCARDRMIPDTRLRALVEKITAPPQDAIEPQGPGAQQDPGAEPEPGRPVQLVRLDEKGGLTLDEEALSRCLEQGGVGGAPLCLVSVIGEQRRGKSFLLNCLLRRLRSPEAGDTAWMEPEDEALGGFESCTGKANVTKGVWMWGQPLWVQKQGRKVAVFLVDTEGCLDLQRDMETSIKLSVFSILLSSYWIFNISCTFKRLEADYMEMFLRVAKEVGGTCNLPPIQPLDLLVRDWQLSRACGAAEGQEYLRDIARQLEATAEQPLVLEALQASGTQCYLLPHPGTRFTRSGAGTLSDMEPGFRQHLCDYVSSLARATGTHMRMDRAGKVLSAAQLAARIKDVSRFLKTKRYDFSSPGKMAESLTQMREEKNSKALQTAKREYGQFVQELDRGHQSMHSILSVEPAETRQRLEGKRQELQGRCREELWGPAPQSQAALQELEKELARQGARFLQAYEQRFQVAKENSKAIEDAKREYGQFVQELDRGHQSMHSILRLKPAEMQWHLEGKRQELQGRCREGLCGQAPQRKAAQQELEKELARQGAQFLQAYEQRFQVAKENSKAIEDAKREYGQFVQELDRGHQSTHSILSVEPAEMWQRLEGKRQELQGCCREELWGPAPQSLAALQELEEELARQGARFLQAYEQRFQVAKENSKAIEDAKREYGQFVQELDRGHQSTHSILRLKPAEMQWHLEGKRQELQGRCREGLCGQAPQRKAALQELEKELARQGAQFLQAYEQRFQVAKENSKAIEDAKREYGQFVQELDRGHQSTHSILRLKPAEMQWHLEGKRQELQGRCREGLCGQAPQRQAALQELEKELARQGAQFLQAYEQRFQVAKENSKVIEDAKREYGQFVQELDRGHQSIHSILRLKPAEMQWHLEGKRQELQGRCREGLCGQAPQRQAALQELEKELARQGAQFLQAYEQHFQVAKENSKAIEDAKREYGQFVQELDRSHRGLFSWLNAAPAERQQLLEGKRRELRDRCRGELRGPAPQRQAALQELEEELQKPRAQFQPQYEPGLQNPQRNNMGLLVLGAVVVVGAAVAVNPGLLPRALAIGAGLKTALMRALRFRW